MEENSVNKDVCAERTKSINERIERDEIRISKQEEMQEKLSAATITMTEILRRQTSDIEEHGNRIQNIEKKPSNFLEKAGGFILAAVISVLVNFIMYKFLNG